MILHTGDGNLGAVSYMHVAAKNHQILSQAVITPPMNIWFMSNSLFQKKFSPQQKILYQTVEEVIKVIL